MDIKSIFSKTTLVAVIFLVVGIIIGFFIQPANLSTNSNKFESSLSILSSPVVAQISAFGEVTGVSGQTITVSANKGKQNITIGDKTLVQTYIKEKMQDIVPRVINLSDIKIGQSVNISLKILPSGDLQVVSVSAVP